MSQSSSQPPGAAPSGAPHLLLHLDAPIVSSETEPRRAALDYLSRDPGMRLAGAPAGDLFDFLLQSIGNPDEEAPGEGVWLRWQQTRTMPAYPDNGAETTIVPIRQVVCVRLADGQMRDTVVRGAGLRVTLSRRSPAGPFVITGSSSTARRTGPIEFDPAERARATALLAIGDEALLAAVERAKGLPSGTIARDTATAVRVRRDGGALLRHGTPVGVEVEFMASPAEPRRLAMGGGTARSVEAAPISYRAILDFDDDDTPRVVSIRAQLTCCAGAVYPLDPTSATGDLRLRPGRPATPDLDAQQRPVTLQRLKQPPPGAAQRLSGDFVAVGYAHPDENPLGISPPENDFVHSSRTDDFAAVSAYHHCDAMFALAAGFGFDETNLFWPHGQGSGSQFPLLVVPRAPITLNEPDTNSPPFTDGQVFTVNAQVVPGAGKKGGIDASTFVEQIRFALGDLGDGTTSPIAEVSPQPGTRGAFGAAADPRWAWHEFGHALLIAGTGHAQLGFAHSVGDALAAIMSDPRSQFADPRHPDHAKLRGLTFPFVYQPARRHDREPGLGWGWHGQMQHPAPDYPHRLDPDGYASEEILSSTLFRIYRALGGDATLVNAPTLPDIALREAAAHYVAYLIMRAVGSLGPAATVPATAEAFAAALMTADADTGTFQHGGTWRQGGAAAKVIRWAFQRQGLYQKPGTPWPNNAPGEPAEVEIAIADRAHDYDDIEAWKRPGAAVTLMQTGAAVPAVLASPLRDLGHDVKVQVRNRAGGSPASGVRVEAWAARGADCLTWDPTRWTRLTANNAGPQTIQPDGSVEFGPFDWTPSGAGRHALLLIAESDADPSVLSWSTAAASGPTPIAELVPYDNNLAYRRWDL